MQLSPQEKAESVPPTAAFVPFEHNPIQVKLNYPEAVAYLSAAILEGARDGRTVADLMSYGTTLLTKDDVMEGVAEMVDEVLVEPILTDPPLLEAVHTPLQ
uniref:Urease subunit gamma n=1 Tax=Limnospira platensis AV TaxID=459838 RepID=D7RGY7_LIMPL|nr:urease gamma subunit [Arthrospira platensis AV]